MISEGVELWLNFISSFLFFVFSKSYIMNENIFYLNQDISLIVIHAHVFLFTLASFY